MSQELINGDYRVRDWYRRRWHRILRQAGAALIAVVMLMVQSGFFALANDGKRREAEDIVGGTLFLIFYIAMAALLYFRWKQSK